MWLQRVSAEISHHQITEHTKYFEGIMEIEVCEKEMKSHFATKV